MKLYKTILQKFQRLLLKSLHEKAVRNITTFDRICQTGYGNTTSEPQTTKSYQRKIKISYA